MMQLLQIEFSAMPTCDYTVSTVSTWAQAANFKRWVKVLLRE